VAAQKEPTNFRQWALLARVDLERGRSRSAIADIEQARSLARRATILIH
jgi:cytochrome c-type biogenesis protein CcmH/NrfG